MSYIPLIRASSVAKLMTEPRTKADKDAGKMSETALGHCIDLAKQAHFGVDFFFGNKYTEKGIECEDESIALFNELRGTNLVKVQDAHRHTKDGLTGLPDLICINDRHGIDIKTAWSIQTFPALACEVDDKGYEWQARAYMALFDCDTWEIAYCLVNTPDRLLTWMDEGEKMLHTNLDLFSPCQRVTTFCYTRDQEKEDEMFKRVSRAREEIGKMLSELRAK
jgi:hypothetical protein